MVEDFNLEDLISESEDQATGSIKSHQSQSCSEAAEDGLYRDRTAAAISGGNAKNLLDCSITHDQLSYMTPDEISILYAEYTALMGQSMGKGILQLASTYTGLV